MAYFQLLNGYNRIIDFIAILGAAISSSLHNEIIPKKTPEHLWTFKTIVKSLYNVIPAFIWKQNFNFNFFDLISLFLCLRNLFSVQCFIYIFFFGLILSVLCTNVDGKMLKKIFYIFAHKCLINFLFTIFFNKTNKNNFCKCKN